MQGLNLRKIGDSLGKSDSPSQIASLELGRGLHGLDSVVVAWPSLSQPLKAAIFAIVNSSDIARPATGLEGTASGVPPQSNFPAAIPSATGELTQKVDGKTESKVTE